MSESVANWFVVHTQPHAEEKAATHLMRQGYAVFVPRYLRRRSHARKVETVVRPLFPRYIFTIIDLTKDRWRSILSTVGVSSLVCQANLPARVPDGIVEQLIARADERGLVELDCRPKLIAGQKVRLIGGAFADLIGVLERMTDRDRVAVLLDIMGRKVRVTLDTDALEPAS